MPEDRPLIGLRRGVIGLHYGLKLRWIRFDSVPVLEWIVITGSLDWAKNASGPGILGFVRRIDVVLCVRGLAALRPP